MKPRQQFGLAHFFNSLFKGSFGVGASQDKPNQRNMRPKVLKDFCESTSLHGYSYLTADSVLSKVVWAIIILIATIAGLYFIAINTRDYMKASIVTNIESTSETLHVSNIKNA